jgi:hypothetical protein
VAVGIAREYSRYDCLHLKLGKVISMTRKGHSSYRNQRISYPRRIYIHRTDWISAFETKHASKMIEKCTLGKALVYLLLGLLSLVS